MHHIPSTSVEVLHSFCLLRHRYTDYKMWRHNVLRLEGRRNSSVFTAKVTGLLALVRS